ncbi:hypothetical protein AQPE_3765 [Aquipluma nitroreducens]|uniref:Uncharacterized protein n=1 Tax=Aquipluma nitroreducens TaxID=2010828 RepID=A0A5K7SDM0_9BACT|nr:hypothetical protein [Aquipluma nitroreducens]BBE19579.1 hypothetical protein AQPE_3765 [Aquipluma nitroreducens]
MVSNSLSGVASISQWTLFLGIGLIFFSWIEKKEKLALAGQVIFIVLGLISLWVLLTNSIVIPEVIGNTIPKEVKILSYFKLAAFFSGFNLISLLLNLFKVRYHKFSLYLVVFIGLMLFFMVFGILQTPN